MHVIDRLRSEILLTQFLGEFIPAETWVLLVTRFPPSHNAGGNLQAIHLLFSTLIEVYLEST